MFPQLSINDTPIPVKTEIKFMGAHLNENLTWRAHVKAKKRQLDLTVENESVAEQKVAYFPKNKY